MNESHATTRRALTSDGTDAVQYKSKPGLSERADGQVTFVNTERETRTAALMFLDGKVFTTASLDQLVMYTRLKEFVTTAQDEQDSPKS